MPRIRFTSHLFRFFPGLKTCTRANGLTVAEVLRDVDSRFPGFAGYIVDEHGALRKHVAIFVRGAAIEDNQTLSDSVAEQDELFFAQALSGG